MLLLFLGMAGCATPMPPTGGPPDETGPKVEYLNPKPETTNFEGRRFEIGFDEFVDRRSVAEALTIEPDLGIPYQISWKRKTLIVEFERRFPDSTTVLLKLGTELTDTRNNNIESPITIAVSTGDEIDSGEISGRIRMAGDGAAAKDQRVLLYRQPVDLSAPAQYETQADTGGVFEFLYLAPGTYQALLVDDRNRNKIWDREIESAFPFFREFVTLQREERDTLDVLYTVRQDTLAPVLQGVGLFSTHRMRLRYSENISLQDSVQIRISDSLGTVYTNAYPLYISPKNPFVLFAQSRDSLKESSQYTLQTAGITDIAGNEPDTTGFGFTGSAQEDTTLQRIIGDNGEFGLLQHQPLEITYAAPISKQEITDSLIVIEGNVDFDDWPAIEVDRNVLSVYPQDKWIEDVEYQFLIWNPVTQRRKMYQPEIYDSTEYGEIEVRLNNSDSLSVYRLELKRPNGELLISRELQSETTLRELPPVSYTIIVYEDKNENGQWDRGKVIPYEAPEPYYVQQNLRVQEGFTSEVNITF